MFSELEGIAAILSQSHGSITSSDVHQAKGDFRDWLEGAVTGSSRERSL